MKKIILLTASVMILMLGINLATPVFAQNPPPPPDQHGSNTNQTPPGGGVPVGSGLVILLALGAAYGGKKVYEARRKPAD